MKRPGRDVKNQWRYMYIPTYALLVWTGIALYHLVESANVRRNLVTSSNENGPGSAESSVGLPSHETKQRHVPEDRYLYKSLIFN
jgi:hypothetical protein